MRNDFQNDRGPKVKVKVVFVDGTERIFDERYWRPDEYDDFIALSFEDGGEYSSVLINKKLVKYMEDITA
jgi:hypothetical protein